MQQLVQNLKTGEMKLIDAPTPSLSAKNVLVRVHHSLISAGTEGSKVSTARKGYIGKAKEKPDQVKQVIDTIQKEGITNTYRKVMNKLDAWSPLGYSCTGEIIEVGREVSKFKIGDSVACAGQDLANHAEIVSVPINLCAKLPQNVKYQDAAYTTVGSIALQGIRQADLKLGEFCVVIGLGLIGQLTVQMLKASGITVFGIDIDSYMVETSGKSGADFFYLRNNEVLEQSILSNTNGHGVDAVIITAGTNSLDPVELAGRLARKKGKVIIVGAVPTGFSRENYYKKELDLRMSSSYGPGRYDPDYEDKGVDYPYGYVRWTENRNMEAFLNLISQGKLNFTHLTTHTYDIDDAIKAFDLILNKPEPYLGIILKYHPDREIEEKIILNDNYKKSSINIGFIGAGSFAQSFLLPNVIAFKDVSMIGVATAFGHEARTVAERYNFSFTTGNYHEITENKDINVVFIATRHNLHAEQILSALKNGKHVFVEKPLALTLDELEKIKSSYFSLPASNRPHLMLGFNRRFAPHIQKIKSFLKNPPYAINYRINAGYIPREHWTQDPEIGGGRIIGEVCHFVDLVMFLSSSLPSALQAFVIQDSLGLNDTLICNLQFKNGSIATISYFSNGSKSLQKEYLEVYNHGFTAILNDFKELMLFGKKKTKQKLLNQDKGQKNEVEYFLQAIKEGKSIPIPFEEIYMSSLMSFKILESINTKSVVNF